MRLSNKDLVLLIGIVVAVVITLTTLVYKDKSSAAGQIQAPKKTSLNITAHKLIEFMSKKAHVSTSVNH